MFGGGYVRPRLARFRADPKRVRVSVRRWQGEWIVFVVAREGTANVSRTGNTPRKALARALRAAEWIPGVDLGMGWAYEHPWGTTH